MLFYKKGKRLNKILEMQKESPFVKFLERCKAKNIVPNPIGIINSADKY